MIGSIVRNMGAFVAGIALALVFIVGTEWVWAMLFPFPPGVDPNDMQACKAHLAQLPASAFPIASVGWGLSTLSGTWVATGLGTGRHPAHGLIVGIILLVAALLNMLMLPYPIVFWITNLIVLPAGIWIGVKLGRAAKK